MKYFTAKGDGGTTKLFTCPQGIHLSKGSGVFEVLGGVDELNSFVGWCRAVVGRSKLRGAKRKALLQTLLSFQEDLFIVQAELGGGEKRLSKEKVEHLEQTIEKYANAFPEIRSFVIPGASELGALLDVTRTIARLVERLYVRVKGEDKLKDSAIGPYLNRASSLLYVLARYANHELGAVENPPSYH